MFEQHASIHHLLAGPASQHPEAVALLAPGHRPVTYGRLLRQVGDTVGLLNAMGIGRQDCVALSLSNGPGMAVAALAVMAGATCAPLNPGYQAHELALYLADLHPKVLLVEAGVDSPAVAVATSLGITSVALTPLDEAQAGVLALPQPLGHQPYQADFAQADDVALLLPTSGTTSRPKLVPLTHANLCHSAHNIQETLALSAQDCCLNVMPLFHIHGLVGALLASLAAGGSVVCTPGCEAVRFFAWLDEFCPTWYTAVPTMHQAILTCAPQANLARHRLRFIRSSSAALPVHVLAELEQTFHVPVIEAYGMTEAAHQMASNPLPPGPRKPGSVGLATGLQISVMDQDGYLLTPGEKGEVVIRGANVMPGYVQNPGANEAAFSDGWFRTGDEGFLDTEGYLFLTGRIKEIINRGGEKIAPREVDEILLSHPAVAQALTFSIPHARLGEEVGAAVVLHEAASITENALRAFVTQHLAAFKVPRRIVFLEALPQGPTGKLQRLGLAAHLGLAEPDQAPFTAPGTPTEAQLCDLWCQVLGRAHIGVYDDFFHLGGDSLMAMQLLARIREVLGTELSIISLFQLPTIASMAGHLDAVRQTGHTFPTIPVIAQCEKLPLSFAQQRMWFLVQYEEEQAAYNRPAVYRLTGQVQVSALAQSLSAIVARHESLRTTFHSSDGEPFQVIRPASPLTVPVLDLRAVPEAQRLTRIEHLIAQEARHPFDLAYDVLLRATLLRLNEAKHLLLMTMHHIASDGWSTGILMRELAAFYNAYTTGMQPDVPALPIQYVDVAAWQRSWLCGEKLAEQLAYWRGQLQGSPAVLQLPTDHLRPARQTYQGACASETFPLELANALHALSHQEGVTLFMTLLAAFQVILHRYTGSEDIILGSPVANRTTVAAEALIGLFANTLVLRTDVSDYPSFRQLLARVRQVALEAYTHQDLPFELLVQALQPERNLSHSPVFQVMFQLRNLPPVVAPLHDLTLEEVEIDPGVAQYDLMLDILAKPQGLYCRMTYNTDLFEAATMHRLLGHYRTVLEAVVANPDTSIVQLPMLTGAERHQLLVEWNDTQADYPRDKCLHQLFEEQVARTPDAVAVIFEGTQITYHELNEQANQLAHYLQTLGVGPEVCVGLCLERSIEMLIGLLGILKAGGAYVPLDPTYPQERLAFMLSDAQVAVLLTHQHLLQHLPAPLACVCDLDADREVIASGPTTNLPSRGTSRNLAYVIYTSGSTGVPKGVQITSRGLVNCLCSALQRPGLTPRDTLLAIATIAFDIAALECFLPLLVGARLVIAPQAVAADGVRLARMLSAVGATVLQATPATWCLLLEAGWHNPTQLTMLCGGEALPWALAEQLLAQGGALWNMYGPTETTIYSAVHHVELHEGAALLGPPIANTQLYVLDAQRQPLPVGVAGELYIGGDGVARGYLNLPELTDERFIPDPFRPASGARLYKTGDRVRYLPDGALEFLGRNDQQVKLRGFRVELGEVEAVLTQHPAVREAVVVMQEENPDDQRLLAYYVCDQESLPPPRALRDFLRAKLPDYMVPARFVQLTALPLTANGKIDRRALPTPDCGRPLLESGYMPPRGLLETQITPIWEQVLSVRPVGIHDNFFGLGGHSLLATRIISRLSSTLGIDLPLRVLFEAPTVAELALAIVQHQIRQGESDEMLRLLAEIEGLPDEGI